MSAINNNNTNICVLYDDIFIHIFEYLDDKSINTVSNICVYFRQIVMGVNIFKESKNNFINDRIDSFGGGILDIIEKKETSIPGRLFLKIIINNKTGSLAGENKIKLQKMLVEKVKHIFNDVINNYSIQTRLPESYEYICRANSKLDNDNPDYKDIKKDIKKAKKNILNKKRYGNKFYYKLTRRILLILDAIQDLSKNR